MKVFGLFGLAAAGIIGASMALLMVFFPNPADHEALELTAVVVYGVHLVTFALARLLRHRHLWVAWLLGSGLRLVTLLVYAVLVVKLLMFPLVPALIGCATFLFLPTLIEPVLLLK